MTVPKFYITFSGEMMDWASLSKILVVRVGALGDTLMTTPLVRALRSQSPGMEIDFLCSELASPLLELNPNISRLHRLRRRGLPYFVSIEKRRLVSQLRSCSYDLAILLETATHYRSLMEHAGIPLIRSFAEAGFDAGRHCIENYLKVGGFLDPKGDMLEMELPLSPKDRAAADRLLENVSAPRVCLHFGYGPRGRKKQQAVRLRGWSHENFARLARMLLDRGAGIIFTGSEQDRPDVEIVTRQLPAARVLSIAGSTHVREMAAVIKKADLLISVDSAPAHMAAALGTPLIVLWGPGILAQTRPYSAVTPIRVMRTNAPCAPCYGTPLKNTCKRNICMEGIMPESVFEEAREFLDQGTVRDSRPAAPQAMQE